MTKPERLFKQVRRYLDGKLELENLHRLVVPDIETYLKAPDTAAARLLLEIEGCVADLDLRNTTEEAAKEQIRRVYEDAARPTASR